MRIGGGTVRGYKKSSKIFRGLLALLTVSAALWSAIPATAADTVHTERNLVLDSRKDEINLPFQVENMLPGDSITQNYEVLFYHKDTVTLNFYAEMKTDSALNEVLKIRITEEDSGAKLYDGLMAQMPDNINISAAKNENKKTEMHFSVTVYLETSVGNEYQNKNAQADFIFRILEGDSLIPSPPTGVISASLICIVLITVSALFIVILKRRRRKDA